MMSESRIMQSLDRSVGLSWQCRRETSATASTTARRTCRCLSSARRVSAGSRRRSTAWVSRLQARAVPMSAAAWRSAADGEATSWWTTPSSSSWRSTMLVANRKTGRRSSRCARPQLPPCSRPSSNIRTRYSFRALSPAYLRTPPSRTGRRVFLAICSPCLPEGASAAAASDTRSGAEPPAGDATAEVKIGTRTSEAKVSPIASQMDCMQWQKEWRSISTLSEG
mmetsp:Transcript_30742/g.73196  ORF Transcript_30742/g.73196 Transcript_30742/m.73196 type:complete len:224 (+) Transcript_30742:555-1226(+)